MSAFDPDDFTDDDLDTLDGLSDEELEALFGSDPDGPRDLLAGYAHPVTRPPLHVDPHRGMDTTAPLDTYQPPEGEQ